MSARLVPLLALSVACAAEPPAPPPAPSPGPAPKAGPPPSHPGGPPPGHAAFRANPTFDLLPVPPIEQRTIVLISLDTVRADRLGAYGGRAETPNLTALAAKGARFDQAVTHFPETCLSHWAMHSGVPPEAHGDAPAVSGSIYTGPTLAEIAQRSGYATAAFIGGVTLTDASCGLARGFDRYDDRFGVDRADMKRPGREVTQRAVAWMGQQQGPYFAFLHYFDAHFPYTPAPPWDTRYDPDYAGTLTGSDADLRPYRDGDQVPSAADLAHVLALYDGELSELDSLLRPVLDAAGPDALVLVTADHGESFDHDYYFNHRDALWDGVMRVPWILRGPGVPAGLVVAQQLGLMDTAPTLLELAGLPRDRRMVGRSVAPLLRGEPLDPRPVYATTDPNRLGTQRAVRRPTAKRLNGPYGTFVYDLVADPAEGQPGPAAGTFDAAWAPHVASLEALSAHRVAAPAPRIPSADEDARLQALGYRDPAPGEAPPPPP